LLVLFAHPDADVGRVIAEPWVNSDLILESCERAPLDISAPETSIRFDADAIIDGVAESLLTPEISLSGLDAHMAEQELDLFQLAASLVTQTRACSAEIVWGDAGHCAFRTRVFHYTPDDFRAKPVRGDSARFVYRPKDCSRTQVRGRYPRLQARSHLWRYRNCPHVTAFADHIRKNPVFLSLLKMLERNGCKFRAPQSASEKDGDHGVVASISHCPAIKDGEEPLTLFARQPVTEPHAMLLRSFHPADSGGEVRTQQP
jgi:hypothetical protein